LAGQAVLDAAAAVVAVPAVAVALVELEIADAEVVDAEPKVVQVGEHVSQTLSVQLEVPPIVRTVVWPALGEIVVTLSEQPPEQLVTVTSVVDLTVYVEPTLPEAGTVLVM